MNFHTGKILHLLWLSMCLGWMFVDQSPSTKNSTNVNSADILSAFRRKQNQSFLL